MRRTHGFTLIELSIVLVIIGLITGGVLVGQTLIEAARIRKIVQAHEEFATRWNTFRLKYNCLPGDCTNATMFFGTSASCPGLWNDGTCNGDGDKWILWGVEAYYVWSHLYFAGLNDYTGLDAAGAVGNNWNSVYMRAPNGGTVSWFTGNSSAGSGWAQMYANAGDDNSGSNLRGIGLQTSRPNSVAFSSQPRVAVETPQTVRNIDTKMDDGLPAVGKFRASGGRQYDTATTLTCITGSGPTAAYDLTQTDRTCRYIYSIQ